MKIGVTAASGRLGRSLLRQLPLRVGADRVVAVARDPRRVQIHGVETRQGDYQSLDGMASALRGCTRSS